MKNLALSVSLVSGLFTLAGSLIQLEIYNDKSFAIVLAIFSIINFYFFFSCLYEKLPNK